MDGHPVTVMTKNCENFEKNSNFYEIPFLFENNLTQFEQLTTRWEQGHFELSNIIKFGTSLNSPRFGCYYYYLP